MNYFKASEASHIFGIFIGFVLLFALPTRLAAQDILPEESYVEMPKIADKNSSYQAGQRNKNLKRDQKLDKSFLEKDEKSEEKPAWKCEELSIETKTRTAFSNPSQQVVKKCGDSEIVCVFQSGNLANPGYSVCFKR